MIHFLSSMIISSSSAWNFAILFLSFSAFFFSYPPFCLSPSLILRLCGFFPTTLLSFFSQKLAFASLNCNRCSENPFFPFCGKVHKNVKSSSQPRGPKQDHISFFTLHLSIPKLAISFSLSLFFIYFFYFWMSSVCITSPASLSGWAHAGTRLANCCLHFASCIDLHPSWGLPSSGLDAIAHRNVCRIWTSSELFMKTVFVWSVFSKPHSNSLSEAQPFFLWIFRTEKTNMLWQTFAEDDGRL